MKKKKKKKKKFVEKPKTISRIDRSGNQQWSLCDSKTGEVLMVFIVPPQHHMVVDIPPWFEVDREVEWWVTRTSLADEDFCRSVGTHHQLFNQSPCPAEPSSGDDWSGGMTDADWERLGDQ